MKIRAKIGFSKKDNLGKSDVKEGDILEVLSFSHFYEGEPIISVKFHDKPDEFLIYHFFVKEYCEEIQPDKELGWVK